MTDADTSKPIINEVGNIGNYYGGLSVKADNGQYFWSIADYDGEVWQEITKALYDALIEFEKPHK